MVLRVTINYNWPRGVAKLLGVVLLICAAFI